jgi:hypothetical protein
MRDGMRKNVYGFDTVPTDVAFSKAKLYFFAEGYMENLAFGKKIADVRGAAPGPCAERPAGVLLGEQVNWGAGRRAPWRVL